MPTTYYIVVTELDGRFPGRPGSNLPHLYLEKSVSPPLERFERLRNGRGAGWAQGAHVRLRDDLLPNWRPTSKPDVAAERFRKARELLAGKGYAINRNTRCYQVYVIDLDPPARGGDVGKGCVYVGFTSKSPEQRLDEHRRGKTSGERNLGAKATKGRVRGLNHKLMPKKVVYTQVQAERLEKEWAKKLQTRGYCVDAGHVTPS